ncbi:SCO1664 family protein [Ornithinimicrobium cavernae]|uniref:SCO1664 family protein n=1 Tax=Ornithinimicrobium cavernae TaxID=2666047 RepID=UPI000D68F51D|nr:SCO1664 family protein [Ornithinimicrobium cavernae]
MTADDLPLTGDFEVEGVLTDASNLTARVLFTGADGKPTGERALYKPIRGEAPLRDFPQGTLGHREVAAYLISTTGGWDLIPRTVLRDGPLGPGSLQRWIDWEAAGHQPGQSLLEAFPAAAVPEGWLTVVHGEDGEGRPVVVAHRDAPDLASMAVLDLVLNNADRKGAHLVRDADGRLWGFDHGLTLHTEDKLRTALWGWAGRPVPAADIARLERLRTLLESGSSRAAIEELISAEELAALQGRVTRLLAEPVYPELPTDRYPLPWPLW